MHYTTRLHRFNSVIMAIVCVAVVSILGVGCSVVNSLNMFSPDYDKQLGLQTDGQIRGNPAEYPILNNPAAKQYVQNMINEIVQSPEVKFRGKFAYTTEIINDDKTLNAFCTPGGYIYVYTGLIKALDNEASLAGVLGHEIAHAELRHGTERMTKAYGLQTITAIVLGQNPSQLAQLGSNLFGGLALMKNSRADEDESDQYSFKYLQSTRWYPGSIKFFFEKVSGNRNSGGGLATTVERLLSTHPLPQDRIDATNRRIQDAKLPPPSEANLFSQRYQQFKRTL